MVKAVEEVKEAVTDLKEEGCLWRGPEAKRLDKLEVRMDRLDAAAGEFREAVRTEIKDFREDTAKFRENIIKEVGNIKVWVVRAALAVCFASLAYMVKTYILPDPKINGISISAAIEKALDERERKFHPMPYEEAPPLP